MTRLTAAALILLTLWVLPGTATTVVPLAFRDLVAQANLIFTGEVLRTESRWTGADQSRAIVTTVTFRIERLIKGRAGNELSLDFLGGRVGDTQLKVEGVPQFAPGDRGVFFVDTTRVLISPILGFQQGWFRVHGRGGAEYVTRSNGTALSSVQSLEATGAPPQGRPLSRAEFEAEIMREAAAPRR